MCSLSPGNHHDGAVRTWLEMELALRADELELEGSGDGTVAAAVAAVVAGSGLPPSPAAVARGGESPTTSCKPEGSKGTASLAAATPRVPVPLPVPRGPRWARAFKFKLCPKTPGPNGSNHAGGELR